MAYLDIIACRSRSAAGEVVLLDCEAIVIDRPSLLFDEGGSLVGLLLTTGSTDKPRVGTALEDLDESGGGRGRRRDDSWVVRESRRFRSAGLGEFCCGSRGPGGEDELVWSARFDCGSALEDGE